MRWADLPLSEFNARSIQVNSNRDTGTNLNAHIKETMKQKWEETITLYAQAAQQQERVADPRKTNGDDRKPISSPNITPDAIAHQLLLNGKPDQNCKIRNKSRY